MPYPHDSPTRESSDARAALMAKLPLKFPPYLDGAIRSRCLPAERSRPYRVPKRPLLTECRKSRIVPSLGCGAFLKDETLRSPEGDLIRVATAPCPDPSRALIVPFAGGVEQEPSKECHLSAWEESSAEINRALRRDCKAVRRVADQDRKHPPLPGPTSEPEGISELSCLKAADEMFSMFIDESCMEDYCGPTSILPYSNSI
ncbi:hypothetical protein FB451DRAFT_1269735 [Mycena latifolia]|nr:hypothetical protein FB451DRAFT_1269735 [Mycena latifolia]